MKFKILALAGIVGILTLISMIYTGKFDPVSYITGIAEDASSFAGLKADAPENLTSVVTDKKLEVYRWRDESGVMQFSNTPPPSVANAEQVVLDPDSNLVKAVKTSAKLESEQNIQSGSPNPYSVKGMKKVMDDARAVEALFQQRQEDQQKILNKYK